MGFKAGVAQTVITPPVGLELSGYCFGPSVGVLDDLEAQALVLESDGEAAVLITADLIGFGPELVDGVRSRIQACLGIAGDRVLLAGSHTHSGPATIFLRDWGMPDEAYLRNLESQLVGLAAMAAHNLQEASVRVGLGQVGNISENRRAGNTVIDPAVPTLRLDTAAGQPLAVLYSFACHPVSMHSYRNLLSPDYPGYARQVIKGVLGQEVTVLFTLGAAGDINPRGYVHGGTTPERSRQIGAILGCEVAKTALAAEPLDDHTLRVRTVVVDLPVEPLPSIAELRALRDEHRARLAQAASPGALTTAKIVSDWADEGIRAWEAGRGQSSRPCELQGLRLGDMALVALPLEVFVETGLAIAAGSPAGLTMVSSNSNGALGYLPTRQAYEVEDDYTNPRGLAPKVYDLYAFSREAEPLIRQQGVELLESMF